MTPSLSAVGGFLPESCRLQEEKKSFFARPYIPHLYPLDILIYSSYIPLVYVLLLLFSSVLPSVLGPYARCSARTWAAFSSRQSVAFLNLPTWYFFLFFSSFLSFLSAPRDIGHETYPLSIQQGKKKDEGSASRSTPIPSIHAGREEPLIDTIILWFATMSQQMPPSDWAQSFPYLHRPTSIFFFSHSLLRNVMIAIIRARLVSRLHTMASTFLQMSNLTEYYIQHPVYSRVYDPKHR